MINVSDAFDGGAIEVVDSSCAQDVRLNLRSDSLSSGGYSPYKQWFYFRVQGAQACDLRFRILNAGCSTFAQGWWNYKICASYDRKNWFRISTTYDGSELGGSIVPEHNSIYFAYFAPYSWARHLELLAKAQACGVGRVERLCATVEGRDLDMVEAVNPQSPRHVWIIARQHPGETMAEWFVEGLLDRLLDPTDPFARLCRALASFHIVPNMNPDGSVRGNLRTNAAGMNLNRQWMGPDPALSPEVYAVREAIHATGCALFMDIHGEEIVPHVFYAGCEMLPSFTPAQALAQRAFSNDTLSASPDFQDKVGYDPEKYSSDALTLASKYVGDTFQCVSVTLEMPFTDNANRPNYETGWSGARSRALGSAILLPILRHLERLATL